jgi:hypothetical protein
MQGEYGCKVSAVKQRLEAASGDIGAVSMLHLMKA